VAHRVVRRRGSHVFWKETAVDYLKVLFVLVVEELLERKSTGSGLEIREYGRRDPSR
jgi:hypothetical protein